MSSIKDINLAPSGAHKIDWVRKNCPLLRSLEDDFSQEKPFEGIRIALSIHLEAKTAYLCKCWQQVVPRCTLPEVTRFPHRMMWQQHW